jgi:hypothetical protein
MNRDEQRQLLAERSTLKKMISRIPETDVLDRGSFEARLREVEQELATIDLDTRSPAKARLTFRGRPVIGSHGIFAEFAMTATNAFTDAVAAMAAAFAGPLSSSGPIPNREQSQLLITSTAVGSFGFELEEHRETPLLLADESAVAQAIAQTQELLESTTGTDDELTDAAAGVAPRVINAVKKFLDVLSSEDAFCAVESGGKTFRFQDVGQVRQGLERLGQDNLHEDLATLTGEFQGVLPKRRTFEFKLAGEETVITGKIGANISDPDALNRHLHRLITISVVETRVGNGRPRYVLAVLPDWPPDTRI